MESEFRKLEARDIGHLLPFFGRRSNLTCDSVIFDSFLWQDYFSLEYMIWEEKAVFLRMKEDGRVFTALPVCDEETLPAAFAALEEIFRKRGEPFRVCWADERGLEILGLSPERYRIREQTDLADYIYDAEKLRTLAGKKYHKKKNHLNAFLKDYEGRWEYRRLHRWSRCEIWNFLERWEQGKEDVEVHLEAEMTGLHHYLFNMDVFDSVMAGIYIDGKLEAFTVGSYNRFDRMSVVHVEKANGDIRGLYTLINQQFQANEFPEALLVNREDDVGLPSLRKAKESYHPIRKARKFEIVPRTGNGLTAMQEARKLWEEIFTEDSKSFLDYYDWEKAAENRIMLRESEGQTVAMAQWNPYRLRLLGQEYPTAYLVGVATKEAYRHRGFMAGLLREGLQEMAGAKMPFVFLMPADPAIYRPFGFQYIYEREEVYLPLPEAEEALEEEQEATGGAPSSDLSDMSCPLKAEPLPGSELNRAAAWMEQQLSARYAAYCLHDAEYLRRAREECASEGGGLWVLRVGDRCCGHYAGIFSWWQEECTVVRDLVLAPEWNTAEGLRVITELLLRMLPVQQELRITLAGAPESAAETVRKPAIMARIACLQTFLEAFRLADGEESILLEIADPLIPANTGRFLWKLRESGAHLEPTIEEPELVLTVTELMGLLFREAPTGKAVSDGFYGLNEELQKKIQRIQAIRGTFFPEIV